MIINYVINFFLPIFLDRHELIGIVIIIIWLFEYISLVVPSRMISIKRVYPNQRGVFTADAQRWWRCRERDKQDRWIRNQEYESEDVRESCDYRINTSVYLCTGIRIHAYKCSYPRVWIGVCTFLYFQEGRRGTMIVAMSREKGYIEVCFIMNIIYHSEEVFPRITLARSGRRQLLWPPEVIVRWFWIRVRRELFSNPFISLTVIFIFSLWSYSWTLFVQNHQVLANDEE